MIENADPGTGSQPVEIPEGDWRHGLPEDMRGVPSLAPYKPIPAGTKNDKGEDIPEVPLVQVPMTMVKSYVEQQPLIGSKVIIPKEGDKPEVFEAFYKALGRPDKPEGYELPKDEAWAQVPYSEKLEGWFRKAAHANGIPAKVATKMFQEYQGEMKGIFDGAQKEYEKMATDALAALDTKWGAKNKENTAMAARVFDTFFPDPEVNKRMDLLLGNDAVFIEALFEMSKAISEDKLVAVDNAGQTGIKSREELRSLMADKRYGKDKAYTAMVEAEYKKAAGEK